MKLDTIFHGGYVITMEGPGTGIIPDGAVGVKDNRIAAVGPAAEIRRAHSAHREINTAGKAVMPGFVDSHMHSSNAIVRGGSQDLPGGQWMFRGILPLLSLATPEDLRRGSMLNLVEALKAGTTTFADFDVPMLDLIPNHVRLGVRAVVSDMINELPADAMQVEKGTPYPLDSAVGNRKLQDNIKLVERYHGSQNGRITCRLGPQAADMCSVELLREIKALADCYDVDRFIHLTQSAEEIVQTTLRTGKRPVALLEELGYLDRRLLAAHMTDATPEEVEQVAKSGASLALCSNSICIIGGRLPPAQEFATFGGRVALGTDQAPGNNCNMMWNEMKMSALLHKYKNTDATVFPAWKVLRMATIEAAAALGMEAQVGSLREGKLADVIVVDLDHPHLNPIMDHPVRTLIPNLVYAARGHEVELVMIDGNIVVEDHRVLPVDESEVIRQAEESARRISDELANAPWSAALPLAKWTAEGYY